VTALTTAFATVALAALVTVAGFVQDPRLLALAVALVVLVLAIGWSRLLGLPSPRGTSTAILITGLSSVGLALRASTITRPLAPFTALLALSVLLAFLHELLRRDGRIDLVESVTGTLTGQALALLGGAWVMVPETRLGFAALAAGTAATAAARVAGVVLAVPPLGGWVSLAAGLVGGSFAAFISDPGRVTMLVVVAAVVAGVATGLDLLLIHVSRSRDLPAALAAGAAPLLVAGTAAYVVSRLFT
jgi:hypothetical protein